MNKKQAEEILRLANSSEYGYHYLRKEAEQKLKEELKQKLEMK